MSVSEALSDAIGYGLLSARPTAGIAGRLYFATDTSLLYRDSGTTWNTLSSGSSSGTDPIADKFGTPTTAFEFDTSSFTGLTALGSATAEDANTTVPGHYYVRVATNSNPYFGGRYASVSQPFTAIAKVSGDNARQNYHEVGMFLGASTPSAIDILMHGYAGGGSDRAIHLQRWSSLGAFGSNIVNGTFVHHGTFYLAIRASSNTNVDYLYSMDGHVWYPLSLARDPSLTLGSVGILAKSEETSNGVVAAFDFLRIWNSALTFPR